MTHVNHEYLPNYPRLDCVHYLEKVLYPTVDGKRVTIAEYFVYWENIIYNSDYPRHVTSIDADRCRVKKCRWPSHKRYRILKREQTMHKQQWEYIHGS